MKAQAIYDEMSMFQPSGWPNPAIRRVEPTATVGSVWPRCAPATTVCDMKPERTIAEMIEQVPSLLNRKGVLELVEIQKLAAGPCTVTEIDAATGEVRDVWTLEGSPNVARIRRGDN